MKIAFGIQLQLTQTPFPLCGPYLCSLVKNHKHYNLLNSIKLYPSSVLNGSMLKLTDSSGKVRIWDTTNKEHILKAEFQPLGGPIKDLCWDGESKRICVVGDGRDK